MTNYFYFDQTNQKQGPVSAQQLKELAVQGQITPETVVENEEGKSSQAGKIKGLTFSNSTPEQPPQPPKENDIPSEPQQESFLSKVYANAKIAATIVAQQAVIKKLQMTTLPAAFLKLGNAAYSRQIGKDQFTETYQSINLVKERMAARLGAKPTTGETLTLAERTARLAADAKDKVAHEKDVFERNRKLAELGKLFFDSPLVDEHPELAAEINSVRETLSAIDEHQQKCKELESKGHSGFRKKLIAAACIVAVLIGGYGVWGFFTPSPQQRQARTVEKQMKAQTEQMKAQTKAQNEQFKAQIEQERKREEEQKRKQEEIEAKHEQERQIVEARRQADTAARETERRERELKQETERRQRELNAQQTAEEKRIAKELELQAARQEQTERDKKAQEDRAKYAEERFSPVSLDPQKSYLFADSVRKRNIVLELRGQKYADLEASSRSKDWLKMISLLEGREYKEYPDAKIIDSAY